MKQLKCEMCGGTDLIKQDGVFVCQSCGVKYSVEEARRMMIEGTVEVQGTVKVDTTERLKNLYMLARRAKEEDNVSDAAHYYNEIRAEDPNSWEAVFYSLYYTALQTTIAKIESAAISMSNGLDTVVKLIKALPESEQKDAYTEVANEILVLGSILDSNCHDFFQKVTQYSFDSEEQQDYFARRRAAMGLIYKMAVCLLDEFDDPICALIYLDRAKSYIVEKYPDVLNDPVWPPMWKREKEYKIIFELYDKIDNHLKEQAEQKRVERINEYWLAHQEEKERLEKRLSQIEELLSPLVEQRDALNKKKASLNKRKNEKVSAEHELCTLALRIDALKKELATLGIFSGKRKKAILSEVDMLSLEEGRLKALVEEQRAQLYQEINAQIGAIDEQLRPIKVQIEELKTEAKQITKELTKDR